MFLRKLPEKLQVAQPTITTTSAPTILRVKAITPVLGGGVESFVPDDIDGVRVPSIRGALRWWWRATQPHLELAELREREKELWGGVGIDANDNATSSRVHLNAKLIQKSDSEPAGKHERRPDGRLNSLPKWNGGTDYGYALFPLQQPDKERQTFTSPGDMPTKHWRRQLEFDLHVRVDDDSLRESFFDALTLWLVFGGYGARTRRGFGALESEHATFEKATAILRRFEGAGQTNRPTLANYTLLEGPPGKADDAHRTLLKTLAMFRQGKDVGRNPGQEKNRPGRSRWPEADSLRKLSGKRFSLHPINDRSLVQANAPRAEFGLPIIVQFKDREDQVANTTLASSESGGRFASPVLMRPVRRGNAYVPIVLILHGHRPNEVFAKMNQKTHQVPYVYDDIRLGGASEPIRHELVAGGGHAVDAFAHWLETKNGFTTLMRGRQ
jgi:CRISPR-associated protein Cmr1